MDANQFFYNSKKHIDQQLEKKLDTLKNVPPELMAAMHYVVCSGGKRLRPLLVYSVGTMLSAPQEALEGLALSVEYIHCYSLVHDDLPAMDNDDIRRGQPSCHRAFSESIAILVGDALQSLAFSCLNTIEQVQLLAHYIGASGMVGGQCQDMVAQTVQGTLSLETIQDLHIQKTGALIQASLLLGLSASAHRKEVALYKAIEKIGYQLGLGYQIRDDIMDVQSHLPAQFPQNNLALRLGEEKARLSLQTCLHTALTILTDLPFQTGILSALCRKMLLLPSREL